ncbi:uncharacterized protein LOC134210102 [Armigeres subalbatus]|uniref:uncharacterized protein LOC134210102 n=1 Tax=Armigeres subalbatus TaxID=124917 RepID=UPI002ED0436B
MISSVCITCVLASLVKLQPSKLRKNLSSLWKALEARYENRRWLVDRHLAEIFQLKPIPSESSSSLRDLVNVVQKNLRALSSLKLNLDTLSESMVVHIVASKLDKQTHKDFESHLTGTNLVKWQDMVDFLQNRCRILENLEQDHKPAARVGSKPIGVKQLPKVLVSTREDDSKKSGAPRSVSSLRANTGGNESESQPGPSRVELCTISEVVDLVHPTNPVSMEASGPEAFRIPSSDVKANRVSRKVQLIASTDQALLHTAVVYIRGGNGELQECRAVLDSCAMSTFMTSACVQKLRLKPFPSDVSVVGFGGTGKKIAEAVVAEVSSKSSYFVSLSEFLVTPNITTKLPLQPFKTAQWEIPEWVELADPHFNLPARVEILFGILDWDKMMLSRSYQLSDGLPTLRKTVFGWVAGGPVIERRSYPVVQALPITNEQLDDQLSRFWQLEGYGQERIYGGDEQRAEEHYTSTHYRDESGRYVLALPFKNTEFELGDSSHMAHRRFLLLEKRLAKDHNLYSEYRKFMQEYFDLGHMEKVGTFNSAEPSNEECYFIPHHAVQRPESSTTKVRVVFDASAKSNNGVSLNDLLLVGPTLQPQLVNILLAFRIHKVVATTDVSKMFRQISIREEDRRFLLILWRPRPEEELCIYRLTTVTYGTACAPYQATRTLFQIFEDEANNFPLAAQFGKKSNYVDDALFGAETVKEFL